MKPKPVLFLFSLVCWSCAFAPLPASAQNFTALVGKGSDAADAWLGEPNETTGDGYRGYRAGGYSLSIKYIEGVFIRAMIVGFPPDRKPKTPEDVANLIGPGLAVGAKRMKGILEEYYVTDTARSLIWEIMLTPGDDGTYSLVNIIPPANGTGG